MVAPPPAPPAPATPFDLPIVDPTLKALYRHWLEVRGDKPMPARRAIDAMAIRETLQNLFLYTYDAAAPSAPGGAPGGGQDRFYCRLAGEQINQMVGTVCSKRFLDQIFQPAVFQVVHQRYRAVVTRPTILHMHGVVKMANDLKVPGERLVLPLSDDGVAGDALVGAAVYHLSLPGQPVAAWVGEDFVSVSEPGIPPVGYKPPG